MNTIIRETILSAGQLADLYCTELKASGLAPKRTICLSGEKIFRAEFQNGVLNKAALPWARVVAWAKLFPAGTEFDTTFESGKVKLQCGSSQITLVNREQLDPGLCAAAPLPVLTVQKTNQPKNTMPTNCKLCGEIHSPGALDAAHVILNGRTKIATAFGDKTACGIANLIDRETHARELLATIESALIMAEFVADGNKLGDLFPKRFADLRAAVGQFATPERV